MWETLFSTAELGGGLDFRIALRGVFWDVFFSVVVLDLDLSTFVATNVVAIRL